MRKIISLFVINCIAFLCLETNIVYADSMIMLDPGHTKIRYGTKSCSGGHEFQYNNEMTDFIEEYLKNNNIQVLKTRSANQEISLKGRTENSSGKALFVSIHHDSAQEKYISYENGNPCSNYASGYSIFVSRKNSFFEESLQYAKILGRNLRRLGLTPTLHHAEKIHGENRELIDVSRHAKRATDVRLEKPTSGGDNARQRADSGNSPNLNHRSCPRVRNKRDQGSP